MRIDLNARRAARAEAQHEPHVIELGTETFEIGPELPLEFGIALTDFDMRRAVSLLVGEENVERFLAQQPTFQDLNEIGDLLGASMGESQASPLSSTNGGSASRPTG